MKRLCKRGEALPEFVIDNIEWFVFLLLILTFFIVWRVWGS